MKIRNLFILFLSTLTAIGMAQTAPPPREILLVKRIFLGLKPKIAKEINLTPAQRANVMEAFGDVLEVEGDRIKLKLSGDQNLDEMEAQAMKALDGGQRKRLEELWIQHLGGLSLADDQVAKKIGLTAEQKKKADDLVDQGGMEALDFMSDGPSPETAKKVEEIRAKIAKKVEALLSESQHRAFEDLKGKLFDFKVNG